MNSKFIKTFAVIVIIAAGMTACGQKKNVTTDDVSEYMISQTHTFDTEQLRSLQMCRKN